MRPTRTVVRRVRLGDHHQPKGNVHYFVEGRPMERPAALEIVKLPEGDACHMHYLDQMGMELLETWHTTVAAAIYHAKWEYGIDPEGWSEARTEVGPA